MPQKLIPNHRTINSKQFLNCLMKFCKHSNQCLLTTAFPDRIITRRSRLQKPADIVAVASAYRSIRCKIINFIPDEVICVETRRYSTPAFDRSIQSIVTCLQAIKKRIGCYSLRVYILSSFGNLGNLLSHFNLSNFTDIHCILFRCIDSLVERFQFICSHWLRHRFFASNNYRRLCALVEVE